MYYAHISAGGDRRQTCAEHSRAAALLAEKILAPLGLASAGRLSGMLHDMGKFTDEFGEYLEKASKGEKVKRGSVIHTFAGVRYLLEGFHSPNGGLSLSDIAAEVLAASVGGHHGLMDLWDERHRNGFDHRLKHQPELDARAIASFHEECADEDEIARLYGQASAQITDFYRQRIMHCVSSNDEAHFAIGLLVRLITSALVEADRTDTRCFMQNIPAFAAAAPDWEAAACRIGSYIGKFPKETPIQAARGEFSDCCAAAAQRGPGLYRLDLPTGGGKTLSALRFAVEHAKKNGMHRVFYIAPFLSIIEQNAEVIRKAVGDVLPVLEHHSDLLHDDMTDEEASRTELLQENWEAPLIVTTFVQLLNTLFSAKMSAVRRFHSLSGSVLIIDEIQSLPPRLLSMFNCAINFLVKCCAATVVLCSATQPAFHEAQRKMLPCERLIGEDVCRRYAPLFHRTQIEDAGSCSMEELTGIAQDALDETENLLIICNTKQEAADLYERLSAASDVPVFHLSAGMCMAHRKAVLSELTAALERHEKLICVSTQVIEAGVDISFGSVIRLSAGLDSIVQAAGRCNRHAESAQARPVRICRLKGEKLGQLRQIREAQDALNALLEEYRRSPSRYDFDLSSDASVRDFYSFLYRAMPRGAQDYPSHGTTLYELLSENSQFAVEGMPRYWLNQAFRTAGEWFEVFDNAGESVLVPYEKGKEIIARMESRQAQYDMAFAAECLEQAKPYTVSVPADRIKRMLDMGMLYPLLDGSLFVLNDAFYDEATGIKEGNDACSTLIL